MTPPGGRGPGPIGDTWRPSPGPRLPGGRSPGLAALGSLGARGSGTRGGSSSGAAVRGGPQMGGLGAAAPQRGPRAVRTSGAVRTWGAVQTDVGSVWTDVGSVLTRAVRMVVGDRADGGYVDVGGCADVGGCVDGRGVSVDAGCVDSRLCGRGLCGRPHTAFLEQPRTLSSLLKLC